MQCFWCVLVTLVAVCGRRVPRQAVSHLFTSTANQSSKYHLSMPNRVAGAGTADTEDDMVQLLRECVRLGGLKGGLNEPPTVLQSLPRLRDTTVDRDVWRNALFGEVHPWSSSDETTWLQVKRSRPQVALDSHANTSWRVQPRPPNLLEAAYFIGEHLKDLGLMGAATTCYDAVYMMTRSSHELSQFGNKASPLAIVNRIKIRWDEEQYRYLLGLIEGYKLISDGGEPSDDSAPRAPPAILHGTIRKLAEFSARSKHYFEANVDDNADWATAYQVPVHSMYDKALHVRIAPGPSHPLLQRNPLNPGLHSARIQESYRDSQLVVIDSILRVEVLQELRNFCLESTIWHDFQKRSYLGAYWAPIVASSGVVWGGLSHPLLLHVAAALQAILPFIEPHALTQMWAYAYMEMGTEINRGIGVHADEAQVNCNLWLTPDASNLDATSGGLRVWPHKPPSEWTFNEYNSPEYEHRNEQWLSGKRHTDVGYRMNRAVIFNSSFFHKTLPHKFRAGHSHRRINLTFLFGL